MKSTYKVNITHTLWTYYDSVKDNLYPVKIRIGHRGKYEYITTKYYLTQAEYAQLCSKNVKGKWAMIIQDLNKIIGDCYTIVENLAENFSLKKFKDKYLTGVADDAPVTINKYYEYYITKIEKEGGNTNASTYRTSLNSILKFVNRHNIEWSKGDEVIIDKLSSKTIPFDVIDVSFLEEYELWMLGIGGSYSTVGCYLRPLRTIFNLARRDGVVKHYPFAKHLYEIPATATRKRALTVKEFSELMAVPICGKREEFARDMFLLSYIMCGMNFVDICLLDKSNINGEFIVFKRKKTRKTLKESIEIRIPITDEIKDIIDKWGGTGKNLLNVLTGNESDIEVRRIVQNENQTINKYLSRIAEKTSITKSITMYCARHTFANNAKNSGTPIDYIKVSLGHSTTKTTEIYLGEYTDEQLRAFHEMFSKLR